MNFPFVSRRRAAGDLADARVEADRLRTQRDKALAERDTATYNRAQVLRQLADADATNRRLMGRNLELGRRLSALTEADPEYAAQLERRVDRLRKVAARLYAGGRAEKARADHLQQRLDQALGLESAGVALGAGWQERRQVHMHFDKPTVEETAS
ncbi:hypothetical protein AB0M61_01890 [Streptomyces sp. NPDC051642]|uniref:hypothetical protein n=1 Tax=Streptomyces sp. NPDC051642 TaxID=3154646 RepID=UPI00341EFF63